MKKMRIDVQEALRLADYQPFSECQLAARIYRAAEATGEGALMAAATTFHAGYIAGIRRERAKGGADNGEAQS